MRDKPELSTDEGRVVRRQWCEPTLEALPRLTELTLQSFIPGGGIPGGGGSTVF